MNKENIQRKNYRLYTIIKNGENMNNLREVKNDLLKDWIDYRAETIFTTLNAEDKKHFSKESRRKQKG